MPKATYDCDKCTKTFKTRAALINHQRHHEFTTEYPWIEPRGKVWDLNGYRTKNVTQRPKRNFSDERIAQVLRHISTQLWAYCADKHETRMVEVEAMYAGGNLYIGANAREDSDLIFDVLSCGARSRAVLRYTTGGKGLLAKRTVRFAKKLKRINNTSFESIQLERLDSKLIVEILLTSMPTLLDAANAMSCITSFASTGNLYVVYYSVDGRCNHVEEKFMDILENALHKDGAVVAGKMRPCGTCFGRMSYMNMHGYNVEHGKNPGFLWLGRLLEQESEVQKLTLEKYEELGSHITEEGGDGYGSESDSDGESDITD
jgi:hypothetical protein